MIDWVQRHKDLDKARILRLDTIDLLRELDEECGDWHEKTTEEQRVTYVLQRVFEQAGLPNLRRKIRWYRGDISLTMLVKVAKVLAKTQQEQEDD